MDRQRGMILFECDGCGEVLEPETRDFDAALEGLRAEGWHAAKHGETWNHYCPDCR